MTQYPAVCCSAVRPPGAAAGVPPAAPPGRCRSGHATPAAGAADQHRCRARRIEAGEIRPPESGPRGAPLIVAPHQLFLRQIMPNGTIAGHARRAGHAEPASRAPVPAPLAPGPRLRGTAALEHGKAQPSALAGRSGQPVGPPAGTPRARTGRPESRKERRIWRMAPPCRPAIPFPAVSRRIDNRRQGAADKSA